MSGSHPTLAAIRHRLGQSVTLALMSALVVACAVFAPVYARAVDQGVLRTVVDVPDPASSSLRMAQHRTASNRTLDSADLLTALPDPLVGLSEQPLAGMRVKVEDFPPAPGKKGSPVVLRSRTDACAHIELVEGACPARSGDVLVSRADATAWDWAPGDTLSLIQYRHDRFDPDPGDLELTITGVYTAPEDGGYWLGSPPDGKSGVPIPKGAETVPGVDDLITVEETFQGQVEVSTATVDLPLRREEVTLDTLPSAVALVEQLRLEHPEITVDQPLTRRLDQVRAGQEQTKVLVPLVMSQLGLLAVLALWLVARAAVDQRRHDAALTRLRGRSGAQATRRVVGELAVSILAGGLAGVLIGVGSAWLLAAIVLPDRVPREVPWTALPWALGALLLALVVLVLAARPLRTQSVATLLRPPRPERAGLRAGQLLVIAFAVVGVIGLVTGALSGPAALATPTLLAIAVSLLAASLVLPLLARRVGARAVRRGAVVPALTAHGLARRPTARRVLTATSVAVSLAVFATMCLVVSDDNRRARAELETGAPAVVEVAADSPQRLVALTEAVRDRGVAASPVVTISPGGPSSATTMAVDPQTLPEVTHASALAGVDLSAIATPEQETITLDGDEVTGEITWDLAGLDTLEAGDISLRLDLTTPDGRTVSRTIADLPAKRSGTAPFATELLCPDGCRLAGLTLSSSAPPGSQTTGDISLTELALDGDPMPLPEPTGWTSPAGPDAELTVDGVEEGGLALRAKTSSGTDASVFVADVPVPLPGIVTPAAAGGQSRDTVDALVPSGLQAAVAPTQQPAALPAATDRGLMISLPVLARAGGALESRAHAQIWLADPADVGTVRQAAEDEGMSVRSVSTTTEREESYDGSASGWGLQLAAIAGVVALLLGALVIAISAVSSWRQVARDGASLVLAGVSPSAVAAALRREHLVTALIATLIGSVVGVIGARLALPSIPLFVDDVSVPQPGYGIPWGPVALAVAVALVILVAAELAVSATLTRRTRPTSVREVG